MTSDSVMHGVPEGHVLMVYVGVNGKVLTKAFPLRAQLLTVVDEMQKDLGSGLKRMEPFTFDDSFYDSEVEEL